MHSSTATLAGSGFSEALNEGLLRAAPRLYRPRTAPVGTGLRRLPATPVAPAGTTAPVLASWETEAVLERFATRLPSVLTPAEAELPELRATLESFARTVLSRAGNPDLPRSAEEAVPPAAAAHRLVGAASLLLECALLHVMEHGAAHTGTGLLRAVAVVRSLGEAMSGAGTDFWQGDGGRSDSRRLARQLHDELGGALAAARRSVTLAAREPEAAASHLAAAGQALDEAGQENRALVDGLRRRARLPSLREALDSFLAGARPAASVSVRVTGDETLLPERFRQELFLVLREALRNAFAHAAADRVEVGVRTTRRWLYAKVEDFGPGPGVEVPAAPGPAYGLCSMTERVEELGGRLRISPGEQGGTLVEIHLPLAPRT
ncbi:sensor histidine kinase [Streptomyces sp. H27-H5]|uniref:sensor histidine kinase n=2 Tax=unclassified Streptomyces TaxID=2593676 RepID=UPI0022701C3D|nr:ATP-binding protein [Streptomyces sp. H27-H5]MCY0962394.1 histidine kinase [Streptomyces sp. H27-H5]